MWAYQLADLSTDYRVITPDLPGFGESVLAGAGEIDSLADTVVAWLDERGVEGPVVLGGLSMGGYVALSIALRYPTRTKALLLINSRASADTPETAANRRATASRIEETGKTSEFLDGMLPRLFAASTMAERPGLLVSWRERARKLSPETIATTLRGLSNRPDRVASLHQILVPSLVIAGAEDQIVPVSEAETVAHALPRGRLAVIQGAGHLAPLEKGDDTNDAIRQFLLNLP